MTRRVEREILVSRRGRVVVERRRLGARRVAAPVQAKKADRPDMADLQNRARNMRADMRRPLAADLARLLAGAPLRFPAVLFGRTL